MTTAVDNSTEEKAGAFYPNIPGSKSFTNRALILAAQYPGVTKVTGGLHCDDTDRLAVALDQFGGLSAEKTADGFRVERLGVEIEAPAEPVNLNGGGTPARFMQSFAASASGATVVTGNTRLCERPMGDLHRAFDTMGVQYECVEAADQLPVRIHGGQPNTNAWTIRGNVSSQFLSSILLLAAQQDRQITVNVDGPLVSKPYVDMTLQIMRYCGVNVEQEGFGSFVVTPIDQGVAEIPIEVDASGMSYFLQAAAITKKTVVIRNIGSGSAQGDVGLLKVLGDMGCDIVLADDYVQITGGDLNGVDVDMESMPDVVLTLAAVAALAKGETRIHNIANLRIKECDRIHAAAAELNRLGVPTEEGEDFIVVRPDGPLKPALVETYDDHRVAMAFGTLSLIEPDIKVEDPACVGKSFPMFWDELDRFRQHLNATK